MEEVEDFDTACYGLREIRTEVIEGLIMVDLSGEAPALADHVGDLGAHLRRYSVGALARAASVDYASPPTGRGLPRTTTSACTALGSIPSSTHSATT